MATNRKPCVAVLGAGILGSCTALELAGRGARVVVFDEAPSPMMGASRWNEGKIHLGHLYSASGSMATARKLLDGAFLFKPLLERLLETRLDRWVAPFDDIYLFHRESVVPAQTSMAYMRAVHDLVLAHPDVGSYPGELRDAAPAELSPRELAEVATGESISSGMRVPERSVCTRSVADALARRLADDPGIELIMKRHVDGARRIERSGRAAWQVMCGAESFGPFDVVVNALWAGRPQIDQAIVGVSDAEPNHRYRVAAFIDSAVALDHPSVVIAVGPFGDIKNYGDGRFYVSWYSDGLLAEGTEMSPPTVAHLDQAQRQAVGARIQASISRILPGVAELFGTASRIFIEGGWVYARGTGLLSDPGSGLHRRDQIGFAVTDSYISVDTGKYSVAPLLARRICEAALAAV